MYLLGISGRAKSGQSVLKRHQHDHCLHSASMCHYYEFLILLVSCGCLQVSATELSDLNKKFLHNINVYKKTAKNIFKLLKCIAWLSKVDPTLALEGEGGTKGWRETYNTQKF